MDSEHDLASPLKKRKLNNEVENVTTDVEPIQVEQTSLPTSAILTPSLPTSISTAPPSLPTVTPETEQNIAKVEPTSTTATATTVTAITATTVTTTITTQCESIASSSSTWPVMFTDLPTEEELGIEAFLDKTRQSFVVYFKQRFGDFIVREVDTNNNIVRLTDYTTLPDVDNVAHEESLKTFEDSEILEHFTPYFANEEDPKKFIEYTRSLPGTTERENPYIITGHIPSDKDKRTLFHSSVRKYFGNILESETSENKKGKGGGGGGEKIIKVYFKDNRGKKKSSIQYWPRDKPTFLQFVLYKENIDTTAALQILSKSVGISAKSFATAGTKDKRAVTTQFVTVHKTEASKLASANPRLYGLCVGNFSYVRQGLKLGSLNGNHFTITLRGIKAPDTLVLEACDTVKKFGFVNYFGTQRFGTGTVPTHHVGKLLLLSKWEEAMDLILHPRTYESKLAMEARNYYFETKDAAGAFRMMPKNLTVERLLLDAIKKYGKTLNAFSQLPANMRLLYVHAYQSYVWNKASSKRINLASRPELLFPIVGDLVLDPVSKERIYVTDENVHQFQITDVQIPLPGFNVKYPKNITFDCMKEIMALDSLDPLNMKRSQRLYSLPGGYRPLIRKPLDFEYKIYHYTDPTRTLVLTDLEVIQGKPEPIEEPVGTPYTGIVLKMTLDSSTYATMLIRELSKNPTSQIYQREIQKQYDLEHAKAPTVVEAEDLDDEMNEINEISITETQGEDL